MSNLFESGVDDVIGMIHKKISSEQRLYVRQFLVQKREYRFALIRDFYGQFKKSIDFGQNFIMAMVSLIGLFGRRTKIPSIIITFIRTLKVYVQRNHIIPNENRL